MWVIFEGLDKAGKTTLEWEFLKATNFKHVVIDRGPVGYMTFDKILGRETKLGNQEFIYQARKIMKSGDFMVVYCTVERKLPRNVLHFMVRLVLMIMLRLRNFIVTMFVGTTSLRKHLSLILQTKALMSVLS